MQTLRKLIAGFGCSLIQNHKGHPEENAHLERSHLTDDQEFYIPRAFQLTSPQRLLEEATGYLYYYNTLSEISDGSILLWTTAPPSKPSKPSCLRWMTVSDWLSLSFRRPLAGQRRSGPRPLEWI